MDINPERVKQLIESGRILHGQGLVAGAAGNISLMSEEGNIYISASGSRLGCMRSEDVVVIALDGTILAGEKKPTSEYLLHTLIYRHYGDIKAVLHTHSPFATAVAVNREPIQPIVDEMTILLGGSLDVTEYGAPGTEDLANKAIDALGDKKAVLLANHGAVVTGTSMEDALKIAELVEHVSQVFLYAKIAGRIHEISKDAFETQRRIYLKKRRV